jgi:hypothetical protein
VTWRTGLVGLLKIELREPDGSIGHVVRLCDGGFIHWPGEAETETFRSKDPVFGTIASVSAISEGIDEAIPALDLTLLPLASAAASELSRPGYQRSRVRFWIAEYAPDAGILIGDPELMFLGQIDQTVLEEDRDTREVSLAVVSLLERLLLRNRGNSLNPRFHQSIWPGETGHDNATGLGRQQAWGVEAPPTSRGPAGGFGGGAGFGGFGGGSLNEFRVQL